MGHTRATRPTSPGRNERPGGAVIVLVALVVTLGLILVVGVIVIGVERPGGAVIVLVALACW